MKSAGYQSFCGEPGDSANAGKLAALALPPLAGKSFLDVGSNDGYFCGYAFFDAASRVTGIDKDPAAIARSRGRFPDCNFICADLRDLKSVLEPGATFDIILCSSALHYARDQPALVNELMSLLRPGGTLVLEISVVTGAPTPECHKVAPGWFMVQRNNDERLYPSWQGLENMLSPFVYKHMGASVSQTGDPLERHVFHIQKPLPMAILLMGNPGTGKSTIARKLFEDLKIIHGDVVISQFKNLDSTYMTLKSLAEETINWQRLDKMVLKIFATGAGQQYAALIAERAAGHDFIYDGYIPHGFRKMFAKDIQMHGYIPLRIDTPEPEYPISWLSRRGRMEARKYQLFLGALSFATRKRKHV